MDDDFEPRLGRMRAKGKRARPAKTLHRILAATNLARGGAQLSHGRAGFSGSRIGRGAGVGRVVSARDRYAAFRQRRVIVKARMVSLKGKGFDGAKAHLRYVERDGTSRTEERGQLYGPEAEAVDRSQWIEKGKGDRHQFRFIVSPEDGLEYEDLKPLTRRLMARVEEDLGTKLDWVAVDHFNTGHPHTHIIVRGKDERGRDLIIARDYISHGFRERACELVELDLGPRTDAAVALRLRAEVEQERLTSIDRDLIREGAANILVSSDGGGVFDQAIRLGRLRKLETLRLAVQEGHRHWRLAPDLEPVLRRMGEREDIIRTMQRSYAARGAQISAGDLAVYSPPEIPGGELVGRIVERGFSDEHSDRHYLIVEGVDGRSHYVDIGRADNLAPHSEGAIIKVVPYSIDVRDVDRTVVEVAAANNGRYSIDVHLIHDPQASEEFAATHVRRLEAIRRLTGGPERRADGSWVIAAGHLDRAAQYEARRAQERPVSINTLSAVPVDRLVDAHAATWLDTELTAPAPTPLREAGFGSDALTALASRRQWLLAEMLAVDGDDGFVPRANMIAILRERELQDSSRAIETELGKTRSPIVPGEQIEGRLVRPVDLLSGRHALVERSHDFVLVPWRPVLERHIGKPVIGLVRHDSITWNFGRQRSGPSVS